MLPVQVIPSFTYTVHQKCRQDVLAFINKNPRQPREQQEHEYVDFWNVGQFWRHGAAVYNAKRIGVDSIGSLFLDESCIQ